MNRIYLDTSVFGGYFDPEFELWTKILFDKIKNGEYKIIYSRITDIELEPAPEKIRNLAKSIPENSIEFIDNFKHIVNVIKIRGYNSVNYKLGYKILEIRTPREILEYED